jgi:hypothetical protein
MDNAPMQLKAVKAHCDGQWRIESNYQAANLSDKSWSDVYVCFSGYFGDINPNTFAAAPDLLAALTRLYSAIDSNVELTPTVLEQARAAIAKATQP